MQAAPDNAFLGLKELARYSGRSVRSLREDLRDPVRPLPHYRVGGRILIRRSHYDLWVETCRVKQPDLGAVVDDIVKGL